VTYFFLRGGGCDGGGFWAGLGETDV
jgi:hypothetical protein